MSNLVKRTLTGIVFLIVLIGSITWNEYSFAILFILITAITVNEFYSLIDKDIAIPQKLTGIIAASLLFATNFAAAYLSNYTILLINIPVIALIFIFELFRDKDHPFANIGYTLLAVFYFAASYALLAHIYMFPKNIFSGQHSSNLLLGTFIILWTNDTMAYVVGSLIGKHKLFERISPKKTWEGTIGGVLFGGLAAYAWSFFFIDITMPQWIILAIIVGVFGVLGDLVESMFKRSINVKDSSNILPGHGGLLDRFDGVFLLSPFVFCYLLLLS